MILPKIVSYKKFLLITSFILGLIPGITLIHIIAKDFAGYYTLAESFISYKKYAFLYVDKFNNNALNSGLAARAPLYPSLISISSLFLGKNLFSVYLPIFIARCLICPLVFLIACYYLPLETAFYSSLLVIIIPKLQTYSLSALETDSLVLLFYLLVVLFYISYRKSRLRKYLVLCGLGLGMLALTKETGFPIAIGFIFAVFLEEFLKRNKDIIKSVLLIIIPFLILVAPYFLFTFSKAGTIYLSAYTRDKNISYIPENLPFLIKTIPSYIGLERLSLNNFKSLLVNVVILACLLIGTASILMKKEFIFVFPVLFTLLALSLVNSSSLGGKIVGNFELITILSFAMPIVGFLIFKGLIATINFCNSFKKNRFIKIIQLFFSFLLMFKFTNNFFCKPYSLDFTGKDFYINLKTIILYNYSLPDTKFIFDENGNFLIKETSVLKHLKENYSSKKEPVLMLFSKEFKFFILFLLCLVNLFPLIKISAEIFQSKNHQTRKRYLIDSS